MSSVPSRRVRFNFENFSMFPETFTIPENKRTFALLFAARCKNNFEQRELRTRHGKGFTIRKPNGLLNDFSFSPAFFFFFGLFHKVTTL